MKKLILFFIVISATQLMTTLSIGQSNPEKVENLSSSRFIEFAPTLSGDGKTMIFQLMRKGRWYLFESRFEHDQWSDPEPLEGLNRQFEYIAGPSLSYNGQTLYFTAYQEDSDQMVNSEDIFYCQKVGGVWGEPVNIGKPVNSFMYEGYPSISADGNTIYFMRDNRDYPYDEDVKVHCFKLFRSKKDMFGNWQKPEELPYPVNFNCERSPKIMVDNKTLLFSSLRASGKGKFDLYQSKLQSNGMWTEPVPLDYLNTSNNDQSPCVSANGEEIYYYCDGDIYKAEIPSGKREFDKILLNGRVIDAVFKLGLSVNIQIINPYSGEIVSTLDNTESDGKFSLSLMKGMVYDFNIIQDNNYTYTFPLDLTNLSSQTEISMDFELFSNLNLTLDVVDKKTQEVISSDKRVYIRMSKTPREDIYLLKFQIDEYQEASTFLDLKEIRKVEIEPLF